MYAEVISLMTFDTIIPPPPNVHDASKINQAR